MARHHGPVLVDTNVILECYRIKSWRALCGGYHVVTVEDCVTETQTGFRSRVLENLIDPLELRNSLAEICQFEYKNLAKLKSLSPEIRLDKGEERLWAHAIGRDDDWVFCGPDSASLQFGVQNNYRDRLVSLEQLLVDAGYRFKMEVEEHFTEKWHADKMNELIQNELFSDR